MRVVDVAAEIMKREGTDHLLAYPVNPLTESCAAKDIRPIIVRQERIGIHMADAISRMTQADKVGCFCMQVGPGVENSFGAVAQAYSEGVPLIVMPGGYPRNESWQQPYFNAALNFQHVTKHTETVTTPEMVVPAMRRAFTQARNGRPGPVLLEFPGDIWNLQVPEPIEYTPTRRVLSAPHTQDVERAVEALLKAKRPLLYVGQGVHYAKAWPELLEFVELMEIPVCTSLEGKSAFPETHPLALGAGGPSMPLALWRHVQDADVICGLGASFTATGFGIRFPTQGKTFIHNTVDPVDVNKNIPTEHALIGDSKLTLAMMIEAAKDRIRRPRGLKAKRAKLIADQRAEWLKTWNAYLQSNDTPISPYRVIAELAAQVDVPNTIITHDAGSPRDELIPFWKSEAPHTYIGWGKTTQLGYGLGLAMGAKLAHPDKLCINMWGDAAIGMTGMDFETAVRCEIPILSIINNNFAMAMEFEVMELSRKKYNSTDISGNYAEFAQAMGGHGERVTDPGEITHALVRAIRATKEGKPAMVEFITTQDKIYSKFTNRHVDAHD